MILDPVLTTQRLAKVYGGVIKKTRILQNAGDKNFHQFRPIFFTLHTLKTMFFSKCEEEKHTFPQHKKTPLKFKKQPCKKKQKQYYSYSKEYTIIPTWIYWGRVFATTVFVERNENDTGHCKDVAASYFFVAGVFFHQPLLQTSCDPIKKCIYCVTHEQGRVVCR